MVNNGDTLKLINPEYTQHPQLPDLATSFIKIWQEPIRLLKLEELFRQLQRNRLLIY